MFLQCGKYTNIEHLNHKQRKFDAIIKDMEKYYIQKLNEVLNIRKSQNSNYSLRAFSRDIGLHSSTVSQILNGKRALPYEKASLIAKKLRLNDEETILFIESLHRTKVSIDHIEIAWEESRKMKCGRFLGHQHTKLSS